MANFFERLSYPQYEQNGRFNLLSLLQIPQALTSPRIGNEIDTARRTRENQLKTGELLSGAQRQGAQYYAAQDPRLQASELLQPNAQLGQTRAVTDDIRAQTGGRVAQTEGQNVLNNMSRLQFNEAQGAAQRAASARAVLPSVMSDRVTVPETLHPEALGEFLQGRTMANNALNQEEQGMMELMQNRNLTEKGVPLTQPGQFARQENVQGQRYDATRQQAIDEAASRLISSAYQSSIYNPGIMPHAIATARQMGAKVAEFPMAQPQNNAAMDVHQRLLQEQSKGKPATTQPAATGHHTAPVQAPQRKPMTGYESLFDQQTPDWVKQQVGDWVKQNPTADLERVRSIIDFLQREQTERQNFHGFNPSGGFAPYAK